MREILEFHYQIEQMKTKASRMAALASKTNVICQRSQTKKGNTIINNISIEFKHNIQIVLGLRGDIALRITSSHKIFSTRTILTITGSLSMYELKNAVDNIETKRKNNVKSVITLYEKMARVELTYNV